VSWLLGLDSNQQPFG